MTEIENDLKNLFTRWSGREAVSITRLPGSGSYRIYYRLQSEQETVLGAYNEDIRENEAFISFTNHFRKTGLPVPQILASDPEKRIYLITDLGDTTLFQFLTQIRTVVTPVHPFTPGEAEQRFPSEIMDVYKKAIAWLPVFQVKAGRELDYTVCYPRASFDRQSMMWDLNYFKYYFLKLAKIPFDEQALEDDFAGLCDLLLGSDSDFFLFRDFQSRNIMIVNGEPWFIDYQGGRRGALQYDVASLLTDGKAGIPMADRDELLSYYLGKLEEIFPVNRDKFLQTYYGFTLIRILQALGAYGFRGYYENKAHFLKSIPFALRNLDYLRANNLIGFGLDTLMSIIGTMIEMPSLYIQESLNVNNDIDNNIKQIEERNNNKLHPGKLTVTITSFSFKKRAPVDTSGNGGGFIFDCRALPNPGRFDEFKALNGKNQPVIAYLEKEPDVAMFLENVFSLVDQSVTTYLTRGFENLMVSFGCTGGQHRSVYCAERLAGYLTSNKNVIVKIVHLEQD
ncbi:MAG: RapZ C-terminal domain-containing protein [Bacteroidales bacterium]